MEQGFSRETMLAALRDIRLPSDAPGGWPAEMLVSIGLAAMAALICLALLRLVFRHQAKPQALTLAETVEQVETLPEAAQRVALLHLLKQHAPDRFAALSQQLYAPGALDLETLKAELAAYV